MRPGWDSHSTTPPWSRTIFATSASPKPFPDARVTIVDNEGQRSTYHNSGDLADAFVRTKAMLKEAMEFDEVRGRKQAAAEAEIREKDEQLSAANETIRQLELELQDARINITELEEKAAL